jgi:hypothetical protein
VQYNVRAPSSKFAIAGCMALAALLLNATGCDRVPAVSTPAPTATQSVSTPDLTPGATPAETPLVEIPLEILSARDALLAFLRDRYPDNAPSDAVVWIGRSTAPTGVLGISSYEFTGDGWLMTVAAVSISPAEVQYEMGLEDPQRGLRWTARLDAAYGLLESNLNLAAEVLVVRGIVLAYVRERHAGQAPAEDVVWIGERTTPSGMVGHETCRFVSSTSAGATAGSWTMTVEYDLVPPVQVAYRVELQQLDTGFVWRGQVDAEGTVLEHR